MNDKPKNIETGTRRPPPSVIGLILVVALALCVIGTAIYYQTATLVGHPPLFNVTAVIIMVLVFIVLPMLIYLIWRFSQRNLRRTSFVLACLATLIALAYAEEDWRGWHAWHQLQQQWTARGERFDLAGMIPAPVPDEQNFALTPIVFSSYGYILTRAGKLIPEKQRPVDFVQRMNLSVSYDNNDPGVLVAGNRVKGKFTDLPGWQHYYREQSAQTNEFPVPPQPGSPAADVLLALGKYDSILAELRAASQLPASRFPLNYDSESPAMILLPHLAALKECARVLQLRSAAELQNNQPDLALEDVRLGLQLTDKIQSEPFLISHLVRLAMMQLMLQTVWEGLADHKWSDAQLAALNAALAPLDLLTGYQTSMRGEMICQNGEIDMLRRHPGKISEEMGFRSDNSTQSEPIASDQLLAQLIPSGWFYQNQYRFTRMMLNYYLPVANLEQKTILPKLARAGDAAVAAEVATPSPFNLLERMMLPALGAAAKRFAYGQDSVELARTAIALERYRLAHGEFPASLAALVPGLLAQVPHDVIGGQPLKYRREAGGQFVLYSIGWNEQDDGGVSVFRKGTSPQLDLAQGDWVWQYPKK